MTLKTYEHHQMRSIAIRYNSDKDARELAFALGIRMYIGKHLHLASSRGTSVINPRGSQHSTAQKGHINKNTDTNANNKNRERKGNGQ